MALEFSAQRKDIQCYPLITFKLYITNQIGTRQYLTDFLDYFAILIMLLVVLNDYVIFSRNFTKLGIYVFGII